MSCIMKKIKLYENDLKSSKAQYNVTLKHTVECTAKVCLQQKQFSGVISTQSMFYNHIHLSTLCLNYLPGCFLQVNHFSGEANLFKSKWHLILGTNCVAIYIFFMSKVSFSTIGALSKGIFSDADDLSSSLVWQKALERCGSNDEGLTDWGRSVESVSGTPEMVPQHLLEWMFNQKWFWIKNKSFWKRCFICVGCTILI